MFFFKTSKLFPKVDSLNLTMPNCGKYASFIFLLINLSSQSAINSANALSPMPVVRTV